MKINKKKIKFLISDENNLSSEILSEIQVQQELLKLLETKNVISIEVFIKKKEPAYTTDSKD